MFGKNIFYTIKSSRLQQVQPKLKIAICIPWFTPAYKAGGPIRSIENMVKQLGNDYEFYILAGTKDLNGELLKNIKEHLWQNFEGCAKVYYCPDNALAIPLMELKKLIKPDIVYITGLFSWHFNLLPLLYLKQARTIISTRGMASKTSLKKNGFIKKLYLILFKFLLPKNTVFHATHSAEIEEITQTFGKRSIFLAENYPAKFKPVEVRDNGSKLRLCTVSLITEKKNQQLVISSLKNIKQNILYNIYGPIKDAKYWAQCLKAIKGLPKNIEVVYRGSLLPTEVETALQQNDVFILPSSNENYSHAIAEALSAGLPCIVSNNTPWNELSTYKAGINISINADDVANAISYFANLDKEQKLLYSKGACNYYEQKVNIEKIRTQYTKLFGLCN